MRISPGTLLLGVVAVMFGLLGAYIVHKNSEEKSVAGPQEPAAPQVYTVPRASVDLKAGREITMGDILLSRMTAAQIREAGLPLEFMGQSNQIIGRTLMVDLPKGSAFDTFMFYPEGTGPNIVNSLSPGMRAVTIKVENDEAVEGFATPGTWVDVLFRSEEDDIRDLPEMTVNLLEGVKVLAVNTKVSESRTLRGDMVPAETSVTLAVAPDQAVALRVVEGRGSLALALRHPDDVQAEGALAGMTLDRLLNRPINRRRIEVFRGRTVSQVEFRETMRAQIPENPAVAMDPKKQANARPAAGDAADAQ